MAKVLGVICVVGLFALSMIALSWSSEANTTSTQSINVANGANTTAQQAMVNSEQAKQVASAAANEAHEAKTIASAALQSLSRDDTAITTIAIVGTMGLAIIATLGLLIYFDLKNRHEIRMYMLSHGIDPDGELYLNEPLPTYRIQSPSRRIGGKK